MPPMPSAAAPIPSPGFCHWPGLALSQVGIWGAASSACCDRSNLVAVEVSVIVFSGLLDIFTELLGDLFDVVMWFVELCHK